ncbi:TPA: dephospho-CoA kinase, partial [Neisseria meningitidis]
MTVWVGLTGGIGSGKSAAAQCFADLGVPRIDADAAAHSLTASDGIALPEIRRLFGDTVFDTQGLLRRDILRKEVFASPSRKALLESVMLP